MLIFILFSCFIDFPCSKFIKKGDVFPLAPHTCGKGREKSATYCRGNNFIIAAGLKNNLDKLHNSILPKMDNIYLVEIQTVQFIICLNIFRLIAIKYAC